jgi:ribosome-binding protein aMBF1 (putative translation factor)
MHNRIGARGTAMAANRVISFPEKKGKVKKGKADPREKLSAELLQELKKDDAYREFSSAEEVYKQLGQAIGRIRKARKMSAADFSKQIGKSETIIARMEKGEYKQYTMKLLLHIAHILNAKLRITLE